MDETNFLLADGRNFGYIVVPVDEINFRLTVRRKLLIRPVSHLLSLEFPLSPVLPRHSLSLSAAWVVGSRARRRRALRQEARRQAGPGAREAVRGGRARQASGTTGGGCSG